MSALTQAIGWLYTQCLNLYPQDSRSEFGDEMQNVFADTLADAKTGSWSHLVILLARELRDLPGSVWREHLRARKVFLTSMGRIRAKAKYGPTSVSSRRHNLGIL